MRTILTTAAVLAFLTLPALAASDSEKTAEQTNTYQASKIIGTHIKNVGSEAIGDVDDVLITHDGRIRGVVADVGGFLGMGERHVLLSWDALKFQRDGDDVKIVANVDKASLQKMPAYTWKRHVP